MSGPFIPAVHKQGEHFFWRAPGAGDKDELQFVVWGVVDTATSVVPTTQPREGLSPTTQAELMKTELGRYQLLVTDPHRGD